MTVVLTDENSMLRDMITRYLSENYDLETRRKAVATGARWRPEVWGELAELGLLGAGLPEPLGGFGGGAVAHMVVMEQVGANLALEPYLETAVIGGGFLCHADAVLAATLSEGVIGGEVRFAFAQAEPRSRYNLAAIETRARRQGDGFVLNGYKAVVTGARHATHLIVTARTAGDVRDREGVSIFVLPLETPGVVRRDFALVDGHAASDISFEGAFVPASALIGPVGQGLPIVEEVVDQAIAATCSEAVGVLRRMLDDTVAYTKQRKQFGAALSEFQTLRHRMVDMFIKVEEAVSMTEMATFALSWNPADRGRAISAAKVCIGRACQFVGQNAVQLHGAIGTTEELAVSHYFKRAVLIENLFGSVDHHIARFAELSAAESMIEECH